MLPVGRSRDANENLKRGVKRDRISWRTELNGSKQEEAGGVQILSYGRRFAIWIPLPITASISPARLNGVPFKKPSAEETTAGRITSFFKKNLCRKGKQTKPPKVTWFCWTIFLTTGGPGFGSLRWPFSSFACSCWSGCRADSATLSIPPVVPIADIAKNFN